MRAALLLLLLPGDEVDHDFDVISEEVRNVLVFEADSVVLSIEHEPGRKSHGPGRPVGILRGAFDGEGKGDLLGDPVHGEGAVSEQVAALLLDSFALESDVRKLLRVEEVGGLQVRVSLLYARVDACGFYDGFDR